MDSENQLQGTEHVGSSFEGAIIEKFNEQKIEYKTDWYAFKLFAGKKPITFRPDFATNLKVQGKRILIEPHGAKYFNKEFIEKMTAFMQSPYHSNYYLIIITDTTKAEINSILSAMHNTTYTAICDEIWSYAPSKRALEWLSARGIIPEPDHSYLSYKQVFAFGDKRIALKLGALRKRASMVQLQEHGTHSTNEKFADYEKTWYAEKEVEKKKKGRAESQEAMVNVAALLGIAAVGVFVSAALALGIFLLFLLIVVAGHTSSASSGAGKEISIPSEQKRKLRHAQEQTGVVHLGTKGQLKPAIQIRFNDRKQDL